MGYITEKVQLVGKTNLFCILNEDGNTQLTIYKNSVDIDTNAHMIIPVPNPESFQFVPIKNYMDFFADCQDCFEFDGEIEVLENMKLKEEKPVNLIPRMKHSSYAPRFIGSIKELESLYIRHDLFKEIEEHYSSGYGFIICKIHAGAHEYAPIAWMNRVQKKGELFIPTRCRRTYVTSSKASDIPDIIKKYVDWDHVIFTIFTNFDTTQEDKYILVRNDRIQWEKLPAIMRWGSRFPLNRFQATRYSSNEDIIMRDTRF